jgi:hypothetical protein
VFGTILAFRDGEIPVHENREARHMSIRSKWLAIGAVALAGAAATPFALESEAAAEPAPAADAVRLVVDLSDIPLLAASSASAASYGTRGGFRPMLPGRAASGRAAPAIPVTPWAG